MTESKGLEIKMLPTDPLASLGDSLSAIADPFASLPTDPLASLGDSLSAIADPFASLGDSFHAGFVEPLNRFAEAQGPRIVAALEAIEAVEWEPVSPDGTPTNAFQAPVDSPELSVKRAAVLVVACQVLANLNALVASLADVELPDEVAKAQQLLFSIASLLIVLAAMPHKE